MRNKPERKSTKLSKLAIANNAAASGWKDRIKGELKDQKLSQRKLSGMAGMGPTSIRHLLTDADTITLETLRRLSNALNKPLHYMATGVRSAVEGDDNEMRRVRTLPIRLPQEDHTRPAEDDHGVIALAVAGLPDSLYALRISDTSMRPDGLNLLPQAEEVLLPGDEVVWSPDLTPGPGELVVARLNNSLCVRKLVLSDAGEYQLFANNVAFGRVTVRPASILGQVVLVHRALPRA